MTEVRPFRGIVYDTSRVKSEDVVSPPYDIITPEMKERLYEKSPYNIVRIDFGKDQEGDSEEGENRYTRAKRYLSDWLSEGILKVTQRPAFYLYQVRYRLQGRDLTMRGVFARVKITELCEGVYPHEATHSKPKADRLNLMRYCKANVSPIFSIFNNTEKNYGSVFDRISSGAPYISAKDLDGAEHSMWIVDNEEDMRIISETVNERPIYIADGHHRYETALEYMKEQKRNNPAHTGEEPYNYVMMLLVNISDGGLSILPTHRLVRKILSRDDKADLITPLKRYFEIEMIDEDRDIIKEMAGYDHAIGMTINGYNERYILIPKNIDLSDVEPPLRGLDVTVLHELIFKKIYSVEGVAYEMSPDLVEKEVREGKYKAGFFLNPTKVEDVEKVALECLRMPPKSTYFYPKILTGLVINKLD